MEDKIGVVMIGCAGGFYFILLYAFAAAETFAAFVEFVSLFAVLFSVFFDLF